MKGFALRLVMKPRHKRTRKWPIGPYLFFIEKFIKFKTTEKNDKLPYSFSRKWRLTSVANSVASVVK